VRVVVGAVADGVGVSIGDLAAGIPNMSRILSEMIPPDVSRLQATGSALLETFQRAVVGTTFGVAMSFPLAILASRIHTPQEALRAVGATDRAIVACAVMPAALPSFINTSLFSLEKATRSSMVRRPALHASD
jgi:ABC-type phosphate/phosphonate transport system permease subunit